MIPIRDHSDHSDRPDRLARLLGPGEAELGCEQCFEALDRYVDAYLAGADADRTIWNACPSGRLPSLRIRARRPARLRGKFSEGNKQP